MNAFASRRLLSRLHSKPSSFNTFFELLPKHRHVCCTHALHRTPLDEKPAQYALPLSSLKEWRRQRLNDLEAESNKTGIPISELQTELRWLMEDAVGVSPLPCFCLTDALQALRDAKDEDWMPLNGVYQLDLMDGTADCLLRLPLSDLDALWNQRLNARVPIQYLTESVHWRDFVLSVGPGVLIPRPETEQIVDLAEALLKQNPELKHAAWTDLGTGSGAIAIGLARLLQAHGSDAEVIAVDASTESIDCILQNVMRLGIKHVKVLKGNWCEPLMPWRGQLAGIVSNPPYIPSREMATLQPEVARHEPVMALDGGVDGMDDIRRILTGAADCLLPGGVLILETNGPTQTGIVQKWLIDELDEYSDAVFERVEVHRDVFGVERFVTAQRVRSAIQLSFEVE